MLCSMVDIFCVSSSFAVRWSRSRYPGPRRAERRDERRHVRSAARCATLSRPACPCTSSPVPPTPRRRAVPSTPSAPAPGAAACSSSRGRPTSSRYRRELAAEGLVFGASVMAFDRLLETIARRVGLHGRPLGRARARARRRGRRGADRRCACWAPRRRPPASRARSCASSTSWRSAASTRGGGGARCAPGRRRTPARTAYAEDLGALYGAYRDALARLGRARRRAARRRRARRAARRPGALGRHARRPLRLRRPHAARARRGGDARRPRRAPTSWSRSPTRRAGPRSAARARPSTSSRGLATDARGAAGARRALRARLPGGAAPPRARALRVGARVRRPGSRRARPSCCCRAAASAPSSSSWPSTSRRLLADGVAPEEVAVVLRSPGEAAALVERVFAAAGIPVARRPPRCPRATPPSAAAVVGLVRAALADGSAADLLAWLRAPGHLDVPALADRLEAEVRRTGVAGRRRRAGALGGGAPDLPARRARPACARRPRRGPRRPARPPRRRGAAAAQRAPPRAGRDPRGRRDARRPRRRRAAARARRARRPRRPRRRAVARRRRPWPTRWPRSRSPRRTGRCPARSPSTSPLALRARRVRALVVARLQEGTFPAPPRPEPFLGDADRRALNAASGLRLRLHEDALDRERALFYAAVSRPTERLALGWHVADDDGAPRVPSLLLSDVRDLFAPSLWERRAPARAWAAVERAARGDRDGAPARCPLDEPGGAAPRSRARPAVSASALEAWAGCPVRWFVERFLRPGALEADPEPLRAGRPGPRRAGGGPAHRLGRRPPDARSGCPRPRAVLRARAGPPAPTTRSRRTPTARARSCAGSSPTCGASSSATPTTAAGYVPDALRADASAGRATTTPRSSSPAASSCSGAASTASTSAPTAAGPSSSTTRAAAAPRPRSAGAPTAACRSACTSWPLGAPARRRAAGRPLPAAGRQGHRARAGCCATTPTTA